MVHSRLKKGSVFLSFRQFFRFLTHFWSVFTPVLTSFFLGRYFRPHSDIRSTQIYQNRTCFQVRFLFYCGGISLDVNPLSISQNFPSTNSPKKKMPLPDEDIFDGFIFLMSKIFIAHKFPSGLALEALHFSHQPK